MPTMVESVAPGAWVQPYHTHQHTTAANRKGKPWGGATRNRSQDTSHYNLQT